VLKTAGALLLAVTLLAACGSGSTDQRLAIEKVVRASRTNAHATHINFTHVRISKLDPHYAIVGENYAHANGMELSTIFFLRRNPTSWHITSAENLFPTCSAAPARIRKELLGDTACYPAAGVYTSVPWTDGHSVRLRYCQRPGGPGNFIAASQGVSCATAAAVIRTVASLPCNTRTECLAHSFRCLEYYGGRYGGIFRIYDHALCTDGRRRIEWDGG